MNDKITIVTAFFQLNRENWSGFERSSMKYIEYFKFWARLKNDMVIYTDKQSSSYIKKARDEFERPNTKIVVIDDWKSIDSELYSSIEKATNNDMSKEFRLQPNNPEVWNVDYNYIMLLKEWCVQDAVNKGLANGTIAWIDFGFNHGGDYYINSEEFDKEWKYNFSDKIHLFKINDFDNLPIYEICRRMNTYIQGDMIVAPDYLWKDLWLMVRENMMALNKCGLSDDDQTILLMSYMNNKDKFEIHDSTWFSSLNDFGNLNLTTKEKININKSRINLFKQNMRFKYKIFKYSYRWYKKLLIDSIKG